MFLKKTCYLDNCTAGFSGFKLRVKLTATTAVFQVQTSSRSKSANLAVPVQVEALRQAECTVERHAAQELRKAKVEMAETRRQQEILALEMQEAETWKGLIDRLID